jgi:hypothetical protein
MQKGGGCEGCYFKKERDTDPESKKIEWGPFCLKTGVPVRCEKEAKNCACKHAKGGNGNA